MPQEVSSDDVLKIAARAQQKPSPAAEEGAPIFWTPTGGVMRLPSTVGQAKLKQAKGAFEAGTTAAEQFLSMTPGKARVVNRLVKAQPEYAEKSGPGQLLEIARRLFSGLPGGKEPSAADFDELAKKDAGFGEAWTAAREDQRSAQAIAREAHGEKPNWEKIQQRYADAVVESAKADGTFEEYRPALRGGMREQSIIRHEQLGTRKQALAAAKSGIPGLTRPPLTDDELARAATSRLYAEAQSKRDERLPRGAQAAIRGGVEGAKMVGPMRVAGAAAEALGASKAVAAAAGGAAVSALNQGLGIASGSQDGFSLSRLAQDAALMGIGEKVGALAALRFPKRAMWARTVGQLGTMEAGAGLIGQMQADPNAPPSEHPWRDRYEHAIETAAMMGTAHAMGAVGKPSEAQLQDIAKARTERGAAEAENAAASELAGRSFHDNFRAAMDTAVRKLSGGRWSWSQRNVAGQEIAGKVLDATLDTGIAAEQAHAEAQRVVAAAAGGDPKRQAAIEEVARRIVDNGGALPPTTLPDGRTTRPLPETGLLPEQLAEVVAAVKAAGHANLAVGRILTNLGLIPEGRYRHGPLLEVDPGLSKVRHEDVVAKLKAGIEANGDTTKIANEIEARVSEADNPAELAAEFVKLAQQSPAGGKTAYGTSVLEDTVQVATERGIEFAGKHYGRAGTPRPARNDLQISTAEFDAGKLKDGTPVSREDAAAGKYGSLVGGMKFHEQRGHWLPQTTDEFLQPDVVAPGKPAPKGWRRPKGPVQAPIGDATRRHLQLRQVTLEEALADPTRLLDLSTSSAAGTMQAEMETARRGLTLDGYRERGKLLYDHELPDREGRAKAQAQADILRDEIAALRSRFSRTPTRELRDEISTKLNAQHVLEQIASDTYFKQLPTDTEKWGPWAGMWLAREAYADVTSNRTRGSFERVYDIVHTAAKAAKVAYAPQQIAQQAIGNQIQYARIGVDLAEHPDLVKRALADQAAKPDAKLDRLAVEFNTITRGHNLGGSSDIATQDVGRVGKVLGGAKLIGKGITFIDRGSARAAYYILRERMGLSPSAAMARITPAMDYGTLPAWVSASSKYFSMIRWPAKVVQSLGELMKQRPRLLGEPLWTPMDPSIERGHGNAKAQAALAMRGIANLALHASKILLPLNAYQHVKKEELGLSDKQLDDYIEADEGFQRLPAWLRKAVKWTWIPTGRTPGGRLEGHNFLALDPLFQALSYFSAGVNGRDWKSVLWQYGQKSVLAGPVTQAVAAKGYSGKNTGSATGWSPGERFWPLATIFMPSIPQQQIEAYFHEQNVPPSEQDALRQVMRTLGDPVQALRPPPRMDAALAFVEKLKEDGVIIMETPAEGGEYPKVSRKFAGTPKGDAAEAILAAFADNPQSFYALQLKMWRDQKQMQQRAENSVK